MLLDAAEHPELADTLREDQLNRVECPHCGAAIPASTPLLYHDSEARCVIAVVPPGVEAYVWQEQLRDMAARLVEHLPEAQRLPYLGDIQIAQEMSGIARMLNRRARRHAHRQAVLADDTPADDDETLSRIPAEPAPAPVPAPAEPPQPAQPAQPDPNLISTIQALLRADSLDEIHAIVEGNPALLEPTTDHMLMQLANDAYEQREYTLSDSLAQVRGTLHTIATHATQQGPQQQQADVPADARTITHVVHDETLGTWEVGDDDAIPIEPYRVLLQTDTLDDMVQRVRDHPLLLEAWVEDALDDQIDRVLAEGYDRLAHVLLHRNELLRELRERTENGAGYVETYTTL